MSIKEYHACRTHVSRGMLADLQRPRMYEAKYITGKIKGDDPTDAMPIGTAIHALALEGRRTAIAAPADVLTKDGKRAGNAYKEWLAGIEDSGFACLKAADVDRIERAAAALTAYLASQGIDPAAGIVEKPIYWQRESDGVACRALPDLYIPSKVAIDVKTAADISDRAINAACFGDYAYWLQDAHYTEGIASHYADAVLFVFAFVETDEPYGVRAYELSQDDADWANRRREWLIDELKRRTDANDWSDPEEGGINKFTRPRWAV